jgi:spore coat polysaccharide biosynthesis predicted glycosyltransferase SpsG
MVFRGDASPAIGAGHVMRLSSIAEEAIARGIKCIFVGDISGIEWLKKYVNQIGFVKVLPPESISEVMNNKNILIIDSYEIPTDEPSLHRANWSFIVTIADSQTPDYEADLLVYPGIDSRWESKRYLSLLSGPKVIPFRKSISKSHVLRISDNPRLLIFGGGTDQFGMALKVAQIIKEKYEYECASFIFHDSDEIEALDSRFKVYPFGSSLDSIIEHSDIVITSASTSSFEVLARGIPAGVIRLIGNQDDNFRALGENGLVSVIGKRDNDGIWEFYNDELEKLITDAQYREVLAQKNLEIFDFFGSSRIVDEVFARSMLFY